MLGEVIRCLPFNQLRLFLMVLNLYPTSEGDRLFCNPIPEIASRHKKHLTVSGKSGQEIKQQLAMWKADVVHAVMDLAIDTGLGLEMY